MKIGFIGLGIMGRPMAHSLLRAGHQPVVFDIVKEAVDNMAAAVPPPLLRKRSPNPASILSRRSQLPSCKGCGAG
jgi:3-hydroxyacyl-CoA dehydrogenase